VSGIGTGAVGASTLDRALGLIAEVPDFPEPGIRFRDLTPMLSDAAAFRAVVGALAATVPPASDLVAGVEARGFPFAAAVAASRGLGLLLVRKPGKLPVVAARVDYELEYGTASLELAAYTVAPGARVALLDDVLATGGTLAAGCSVIEQAGGAVQVVSTVVELAGLAGRRRLAGREVHTLATV
jgi:adenine phosphoribosyltransferase